MSWSTSPTLSDIAHLLVAQEGHLVRRDRTGGSGRAHSIGAHFGAGESATKPFRKIVTSGPAISMRAVGTHSGFGATDGRIEDAVAAVEARLARLACRRERLEHFGGAAERGWAPTSSSIRPV